MCRLIGSRVNRQKKYSVYKFKSRNVRELYKYLSIYLSSECNETWNKLNSLFYTNQILLLLL